MKKLFASTLLLAISIVTFAQQKISGVVQDEMGEPLVGVFVLVQGTQNGTTTDVNGLFNISAPVGSKLLLTCIGLKDTEVAVTSGMTSVLVKMESDMQILEDAVVVGYGVTRKRDLAGAVAQIKADEVKAGVITNTADLLRGRAAGVAVRQTSFEPGAGITVRVRGASSISANNDPLYVVDGIQSNVGNQVSPEDIESIEILKDAAATAIYGARGANGVVIITTKHGASGKISADYSYNMSTKILRNPWELMNAEQTMQYNMKVWEENGASGDAPYTDEQLKFRGEGTDWIKEMTRNSLTQTHALNLAGGTDKVRASASIINVKDDGLVLNSSFGRTSARLNVDFKPTSWLKAGLSAYTAKTDRTYLSLGTKSAADNVIYWMFLANPINSPDGVNVFGEECRKENVYYKVMYQNQNVSVHNTMINAYAEAELFDGLTARAQYSYTTDYTKYASYWDRNTNQGAAYGGQASLEVEDVDYQQIEGLLTYHKTKGIHNIKVIAGTSYQGNVYHYTGMGAHGFTTDAFAYENMGAASNIEWIATARSDKYNLSFFGRAEYVLNDKYIFNASLRADGASNFGAGNKWGYFPAGSIAWQIGDEEFMSFTKPLFDSIKLRLSYGQTGNDGIGTYKSLRTYAFQDIYLGGSSIVKGMYPSNAGNALLHWETTSQTDFGIDFSLLDHKIDVNFDVYDKLTTDLLNDINISTTTTGLPTMKGNNGSIRNRGVELYVNYHVFDTKDFSWTTTLNASRNKNKVESITAPTYYSMRPHGSYADTQYAVVMEGKPLSTIYGYVWEGIIQEGENYAAQPKSSPGDPKFKDVDGNGIIDENDRTSIGKGEPDVVFGWGNTIRYKNWDFTMFFDASIGNQLLNISRMLMMDNNRLAVCLDRWSKTNPSKEVIRTSYKRDDKLQYGSFVNSYFVEDASYLRLSNIEIGYTIPLKKLHVEKVRDARVFVGGNRLLTLTKYTGFDPEVSTNGSNAATQGLDFAAYPAYRQVNAGVKISF